MNAVHAAVTPLYGDEITYHPGKVYQELRDRYGSIAPVELAPGVIAALVLDYDTALEVLRASGGFSRDPRRWFKSLPHGVQPPMWMHYRPNALFADGLAHQRLREAAVQALQRMPPTDIREVTAHHAQQLIEQFADRGEADLVADYTSLLPPRVIASLFGCPQDLTNRMTHAVRAVFDGTDPQTANLNLLESIDELVALKRDQPGPDITSWLIAHPAGLTSAELQEQLVLLMGTGADPEGVLLASALRLLLVDDDMGGAVTTGTVAIGEAIDLVLWRQPPISNYCIHYPVSDVVVDQTTLPAHQPVVISLSAANQDPVLGDQRPTGNRAHLSFGAGEHACPARQPVRLIAEQGLETLLDELPDLALAVPDSALEWRPGGFQTALASLPVSFPTLGGLV